ncbi:MAG: glycosyltransferase family 4 protein [Patescibacteria group bacterium]
MGGAEVSVKEITDRLTDIQFDLITAKQKSDLPKSEKIGNINVYRLGLGSPIIDKLLLPFHGAIFALKLNKKNHYDAFWCIMVTFASGAAYIANWFQKMVPIILTLQEGDSENWLRYRWFGMIDLSWRLSLARTNILTAISNYLLERARRLGYKGKMELIPNGVDIEKFEFRNSNFEIKDEIMLITTSRLVEKNAVGDIIEALKFLPENVKLKILGTGPLAHELKSLTKKQKLASRVSFVGHVRYEEIPRYLHHADIFIRPSLSEGMGNSFIEAMAAGLPVIATPVGGIVDFLKDPSNSSEQAATGLFCEVNNPGSIAEQVRKLSSDKLLRDRIIENARKMVEEKYDWNLIANEMRSRVFQSV